MVYGCKRNTRWADQCGTYLGAKRGTRLHPRQFRSRGELLHRREEFRIPLTRRRTAIIVGGELRRRSIKRDDLDECASKF